MRPITLLCALSVLLFVGCISHQRETMDAARHACMGHGGAWKRVCLAQEYRCVIPYPDAGQACSDSSECKGQCLIDLTDKCDPGSGCSHVKVPDAGSEVRGMCQVDNDPCGSFVVVKKGHAQSIVHKD